jgi:hypothetical protein
LASTALTLFLAVFPAEDEPHKAMAVVKVVGGTAVMIGAGIVLFLIARSKARRLANPAASGAVFHREDPLL